MSFEDVSYIESGTTERDQQEQQGVSIPKTGVGLLSENKAMADKHRYSSGHKKHHSDRDGSRDYGASGYYRANGYNDREYRHSDYKPPRHESRGYETRNHDRDDRRSGDKRPYRDSRDYEPRGHHRDQRRSDDKRPHRNSRDYDTRDYDTRGHDRDRRRSDDQRPHREPRSHGHHSERRQTESDRTARYKSYLAAKEYGKAQKELEEDVALALGLGIGRVATMSPTVDNWRKLEYDAYQWMKNENYKMLDRMVDINKKYER